MKRRSFVAAVSALSAFPLWRRLSPPAPRGAHWVWVHGGGDGSSADWQRKFGRLRRAGITGVLVGGGDLDLLARAAHGEGLRFHRWIWTLNRSGDAWARANRREWFSVSRNGDSSLDKPPYVGYYQWFCPSRPPVREYLRRQVEEIASHPEVDGVHLDYIRHPDVILPRGLWEKYNLVQDREYPEFDFCYCDVCREQFKAQRGVDPMALPDPTADAAWRRFRWDSVTGVVRVLSSAVRGRGREISAAVFPTPDIARRLVRQAWDEWPLDRVFPMLYHRFYLEPVSWIGTAAREDMLALGGRIPLHAGVYLPDLTPAELSEAVRISLAAGAAGVALFEMGRLDDDRLAPLAP